MLLHVQRDKRLPESAESMITTGNSVKASVALADVCSLLGARWQLLRGYAKSLTAFNMVQHDSTYHR